MIRKTATILCFGILLLAMSGCGDSTRPNEVTPNEQTQAAENVDGTTGIASAGNSNTNTTDEFAEMAQALPNTEWTFDTPANHGMDSELLDAMHIALADTPITSAVMVRDGVIVDEYYQSGYDETSVFRFNSGSKSITSTLIGIAIEEGLIESVDVSIATYFPQLAGTDKEDITIRHLLEHTSGLEWYEFGGNAVSFWELNSSDNWVDYVLERSLVATPGSTFNYTTGGTHLLGAILEQATGEPMLAYAQRHLFVPLAMDSVRWRADPQGIPDAGNGVEMTSRDAAKFGQLFLNGGNWANQQLVPPAWVNEATSVQVVRNGTTNGSYGYQWWILPLNGYDTYYALGAGGQFILVVPELDLVAVMTCEGDTNAPYTYLSNYIIAACS